jgi:hypothetical protein
MPARARSRLRYLPARGGDRSAVSAQDPEIAPHVTRADLAKLTNPANYLGLAGVMVDRVLALEEKNLVAKAGAVDSVRSA